MTKYLGIDPGRSKTGLVLTDAAGKILKLRIAPTEQIRSELLAFAGAEDLAAIVMGNGTNNKAVGAAVHEVFPQLELHLVDEAYSTEEARTLYWRENPPTGWRRFIPLSLQVPPVPLDAYAAAVQLRRWLQQQ